MLCTLAVQDRTLARRSGRRNRDDGALGRKGAVGGIDLALGGVCGGGGAGGQGFDSLAIRIGGGQAVDAALEWDQAGTDIAQGTAGEIVAGQRHLGVGPGVGAGTGATGCAKRAIEGSAGFAQIALGLVEECALARKIRAEARLLFGCEGWKDIGTGGGDLARGFGRARQEGRKAAP